MLNLMDDMAGSHPARVRLVLSNTSKSTGIPKALLRGVAAKVVDYQTFKKNRLAFDLELQNQLVQHKIDLVLLAGFMHILGKNFIVGWKGRILNIHPSLLPKYKGLNTHQRVIDAGENETGCTVHEVATDLDSGRILGQSYVKVLSDETALSLAKRVLVQEHLLYPKVVRNFIREFSNRNC